MSSRQGDELLVHGRFLRALARALVSDGQRAEDLVQDTYAAALASPPRHAGAPRAWLGQILRRLAIKRGLREGERGPRERQAGLERASRAPDEPAALAAEIELSRRVLQAVEHLREPYRSTLYLRYYRALTPQQIADEQHEPPKTVKTRLARGLELLRTDLDRQHGGRREVWVALLLPLARPVLPLEPGRLEPLAPSSAAALGLALGAAAALVVLALRFMGEEGAREPRAQQAPRAPLQEARGPALAPGTSGGGRQAVAGAPEVRAPSSDLVRLHGRVCDATGEPVAGAELVGEWLDAPRAAGFARSFDEPWAGASVSTRSDARGEFELSLPGPGLVRLGCERDGFAPLGWKLLVFTGQELELGTLVLEAGVSLAGVVRDERGAPVPGAEILAPRFDQGLTFAFASPQRVPVARSGDDGRFAILRQASGPFELEVRSAIHVPARLAGSTAAAGERVAGLEVTLREGASLRGHVLGLEPRARAGARVLARSLEQEGGRASFGGRAAGLDEEARFEFGGLEPGAEYELVLVLEDGPRRPASAPLRVRAGAEEEIELSLPPAGERRAEREPRPGGHAPSSDERGSGAVEVRVTRPGGGPAAGALVARREAGTRTGGEVRAADREGRLRFEGLAPTIHEFRVVSGVFGLEDEGGAWRGLELGAAPALLELQGAEQATLTGAVRVEGEPLEGARLLARPVGRGRSGAGLALAARSDSAGRFRFADLPLGTYRLELSHPTRARPVERSVTLGGTGAEFLFELGAARLAGVVRGPQGGLAGASVRVLGEDDGEEDGEGGPDRERASRAGTSCDEDGRFELDGLEPLVPLRLEVSCAGHASAVGTFTPPAEHLEFVLEAEAPLELELVAPSAPAGAHYQLQASGPAGVTRFVRVPALGSTRIEGLGAGRWRLELHVRQGRGGRGAPAAAAPEQVVELAEGRVTRLRWDLP